jgi:hypothetical protein
MTETYLHHLWKQKRLPFHSMCLNDGRLIDIIDVGSYNENESGPDFFLSKIKSENITWVGSVEIHVSSSDWYKHNHHRDSAYQNVILHVVYNHDKEVFIKEKAIPVLELKNHIDQQHFNKFLRIKKFQEANVFPCKSYIDEVKNSSLIDMMSDSMVRRFIRKSREIDKLSNYSDDKILYWLFARAFGTKVNQQPFEQLAMTYSIEFLNENASQFYKTRLVNEILSSELFQWKKKGLYNASSPEKRIPVFIDFIASLDLNFPFWNLPASMILEYFKTQFRLANISGNILFTNVLINAVALFLFWKGQKETNDELMYKAMVLLELLPAESNRIVRKWKDLKIVPQNAFESQALLEIYQQFCERKKCLDCKIGINFLNS